MIYRNIAFIGKAGTGKSTAAKLVQELVPDAHYRILPVAGKLKEVAVELFGPDAYMDREILQPMGTRLREIDPDVWLNHWQVAVNSSDYPVINDDMRFENEYWRMVGTGFTIIRLTASVETRVARLTASGKFQGMEQFDHVSEIGLDYFRVDHQLSNDGTRNELADQLVPILNRLASR